MKAETLLAMRAQGRLRLGALEVDANGYRASFRGWPLSLTRSQIELLAFLVSNHSRVLSRAELSEALELAHTRSVDVILTKLRRAVGYDFVRNVPKRGWIIVPEALGA